MRRSTHCWKNWRSEMTDRPKTRAEKIEAAARVWEDARTAAIGDGTEYNPEADDVFKEAEAALINALALPADPGPDNPTTPASLVDAMQLVVYRECGGSASASQIDAAGEACARVAQEAMEGVGYAGGVDMLDAVIARMERLAEVRERVPTADVVSDLRDMRKALYKTDLLYKSKRASGDSQPLDTNPARGQAFRKAHSEEMAKAVSEVIAAGQESEDARRAVLCAAMAMHGTKYATDFANGLRALLDRCDELNDALAAEQAEAGGGE